MIEGFNLQIKHSPGPLCDSSDPDALQAVASCAPIFTFLPSARRIEVAARQCVCSVSSGQRVLLRIQRNHSARTVNGCFCGVTGGVRASALLSLRSPFAPFGFVFFCNFLPVAFISVLWSRHLLLRQVGREEFCAGAERRFPRWLGWLHTSSHLKPIQLWEAETSSQHRRPVASLHTCGENVGFRDVVTRGSSVKSRVPPPRPLGNRTGLTCG